MEDLSRFWPKSYGAGNIFQAFSAVYNGTEGLRNAGFVRSDDTHVPAHNFHPLQSAGKRSFRIRKESFRTDTGPDLLVRHALCGKNRVISQEQSLVFDFSLKYINRRGSQEFCGEEAVRIVIDILRISLLH